MSYKVDIHAAPKQLQEMMKKVLDAAVELGQRMQAVAPGALPAGPTGQTRYMEVTAVGTWTYGGTPVGSNADGFKTTFWWDGDTETWIDNGSVRVKGEVNVAASVIKGGLEATSQDAVYKFVDPQYDSVVLEYTPYVVVGIAYDANGNEVSSPSSAIVKNMPVDSSEGTIYIDNTYADSLIKYFFKNSNGVIVGSGGFNNSTMSLAIPATAVTLSFTLYRASGPLKANFYVSYTLLENALIQGLVGSKIEAKKLSSDNITPYPTTSDNAVNKGYFEEHGLMNGDLTISQVVSEVNLFNPNYIVVGEYLDSNGNYMPDINNTILKGLPVSDLAGKAITIGRIGASSLKRIFFRNAEGNSVNSFLLTNLPLTVVVNPLAVTMDMSLKRSNETVESYSEATINKGSVLLPYEPYYTEFITHIKGLPLESSKEDGDSTYNQELNTFNNVEFNTIKTGVLEMTSWMVDLPTGAGTPPSEVVIGDAWVDTTDNTIKVRRS